MPDDLAATLEARSRGIAARNRRLTALVDEVTTMLSAAGIRIYYSRRAPSH